MSEQPAMLDVMELTQIVIALLAVIGTLVVGLAAIVPTVLEFPGGVAPERRPRTPTPVLVAPRRRRSRAVDRKAPDRRREDAEGRRETGEGPRGTGDDPRRRLAA